MGGKKVHILSEIDADSRKGVCTFCGPVSLYSDGRKGLRCSIGAMVKNDPWVKKYPHKRKSERDALLQEQGEYCLICGSTDGLVYDHCHKSQSFRGFICRYCNLGLGHFKDSPELLEAAANYLRRNRGNTGLEGDSNA